MLTRERNLEQSLLDAVSERFQKLHVHVLTVTHYQERGAIDVVLGLPSWADQHVRHQALEALSEFEREYEHAVIVSPTFTWDDETID